MIKKEAFEIKKIDGADVAKWIKAVDCESTMRGFNSRRSPGDKGPLPCVNQLKKNFLENIIYKYNLF